jgi:hypothetical protein
MRSRRLLEAIHSDVQELRKELGRQGRGTDGGGMTKTQASYEAELEDLADQLEAIQRSVSFRLGHAIVQRARSPLRAIRRLRSPRRAAGDGSRGARGMIGPTAGVRDRKAGRFPIPSGDQLLGPLNDAPFTTMFVVWGYSATELESLTREIARLQLMLRDFKPLFVTDSDSWTAFQERGYWFEYIPPADEWTRRNEASEWPDYVGERIDSIVATYVPDRIIVFEHGTAREALSRGVLNGVVGKRSAPAERAKLLPKRGMG